MSRFTGWTAGAVERINGGKLDRCAGIKIKITTNSKPDYPGQIATALEVLGFQVEREYKFLHDRRFRFDLAIVQHKIAIEFEGGIFTNGRHTRGKGYASDAKKYNLANMHGWMLLRYTTDDTKRLNWEYEIADQIQKIILGIKP